MIELTVEQSQAAQGPTPPRLVDPQTQAQYVLLRADVYERLVQYDDSPWTDEEMAALAWEAGQSAGWNDMDDYDHYAKKQ